MAIVDIVTGENADGTIPVNMTVSLFYYLPADHDRFSKYARERLHSKPEPWTNPNALGFSTKTVTSS
jgi:hypothetical protein